MLSSNSIPSKRSASALSAWSIDSGYGPGIHEDTKSGAIPHARDLSSGYSTPQLLPQSIGLGINGLANLQLEDRIVIKEEHDYEPRTPRLNVCTGISNPSSPDPASPSSPLEIKRSRAGKSTKLSLHAVSRLNAWLDANRHYPYPNAETKQALAEACGITVKQVTTWFTNTRQRQLRSQQNDTPRLGNRDSQRQTRSTGSTTPIQTARKGKKKNYGHSNGASPIDDLLSPPTLSPHASMSDNSSGEGDNWQCTFCRKSLTAKSWRRHEETQHHPKYQWTCLATGPRLLLSPCSNTSTCAFCEVLNPDDNHFELYHRISDCQHKDTKERTFGRPDHLQQHARNFHKVEQPLSDAVRDAWRIDSSGNLDSLSWVCGFCHATLPTWDARATHIAGHFKGGSTMAQWRDDRASSATLLREQGYADESSTLDTLASMGATIAGPSNTPVPHFGPSYDVAAPNFTVPAPSTVAPIPPATGQPDLENSFWAGLYGNEVVPSSPSEFTYYQTTMTNTFPDTMLYDASMSVDDDPFADTDLYQNPVYYGTWPEQQ